jgi:hypothetical protein
MGDRTISLGPSAFQLLLTRNPSHDSRQTLQMVISHEMGHLFGVTAHATRCVDVTSYYVTAKAGIVQSEAGRVFHQALSTGQFFQLLAIFSGVVQGMLLSID